MPTTRAQSVSAYETPMHPNTHTGANMNLSYFILRSGQLLLLSAFVGNISYIRAQLGITATSDHMSETQSSSIDKNKPKATQGSIDINGTTRTFLLYIPRSYRPGESALIIALHGRGGGGPGAKLEQASDLDEKADRAGFAVAYLDGLPDVNGNLNWNFYYSPFYTDGPDDVGFVREVIDSLQAKIHPDHRRIYVTGTSAGGFMAQRVGVELSDRVAAIAVVEGGIFVFSPNSPQTVPHATAPISVLLLKGDQDPSNAYCGAVFPSFGIVEASSDQDFEYWTGPLANGCSRIPSATPLCTSVGIGDSQGNITTFGSTTSVVKKRAVSCKEDTEVKLYRLLGGLDRWNLAPMNIPDNIPFNPDLNFHTGVVTNDIIWKFFEEHPKHDHVGDRDRDF